MKRHKMTEKQRKIKQVPFRLHENDHQALKVKVARDGLKIQTVFEGLVYAYLEGNEQVMKIVRAHKALNTVNKGRFTTSDRERKKLLARIAELSGEADDG